VSLRISAIKSSHTRTSIVLFELDFEVSLSGDTFLLKNLTPKEGTMNKTPITPNLEVLIEGFFLNSDERDYKTWRGLRDSGRSVDELLLTFMEVIRTHQDIEEHDPYLEWMKELLFKSHDLLINGLRSLRGEA
jgi:hypothetical protein